MSDARQRSLKLRRRLVIGALWVSITLIFALAVITWAGAAAVQHKAAVGRPGPVATIAQPIVTAQPATPTQVQPSEPVSIKVAPAPEEHLNTGDVIAALSGFYQAIIAILVCLIALVAVFAAITLRVLSRAAAEDIAYNAIREKLESATFKYDLQETIDSKVTERLSEIAGVVEDLQERLNAKMSGHSAEDVQGTIVDKEPE